MKSNHQDWSEVELTEKTGRLRRRSEERGVKKNSPVDFFWPELGRTSSTLDRRFCCHSDVIICAPYVHNDEPD